MFLVLCEKVHDFILEGKNIKFILCNILLCRRCLMLFEICFFLKRPYICFKQPFIDKRATYLRFTLSTLSTRNEWSYDFK